MPAVTQEQVEMWIADARMRAVQPCASQEQALVFVHLADRLATAERDRDELADRVNRAGGLLRPGEVDTLRRALDGARELLHQWVDLYGSETSHLSADTGAFLAQHPKETPSAPGAVPAHGKRPWAARPGESCCQVDPPSDYAEWGKCVKAVGHPLGIDQDMHADINGRTWRTSAPGEPMAGPLSVSARRNFDWNTRAKPAQTMEERAVEYMGGLREFAGTPDVRAFMAPLLVAFAAAEVARVRNTIEAALVGRHGYRELIQAIDAATKPTASRRKTR